MAEQERAGTPSPERHTKEPGRHAGLSERDARGQAVTARASGSTGADGAAEERLAFTGRPQPGEASGIQWWETCGGWNVRYAMGTF